MIVSCLGRKLLLLTFIDADTRHKPKSARRSWNPRLNPFWILLGTTWAQNGHGLGTSREKDKNKKAKNC